MAACVKSLLPLLLLVGMLGLLTVSASAEAVKVTFITEQHLNFTGELFIRGNSPSLANSVAATQTPGDIWVSTVTLTKGKPYQYNLKVLPRGYIFECTCNLFNKTEPTLQTELTVPEDYPLSIYPEIVTRYDCNFALCPRSSDGKTVQSIRQVVV
ncbi:hypothetical protein SUGI_0706360 [Cryptomeria japonica]|uniref:uncharacterized protein LOC131028315 n=1 Tax=Cryptomeria japonica TaxID=3369 RepID=UPI0024148E23|nr:uncharacterized protein LOC131028315 [Cryptomeria japonica]GLJ35098.1 hypothetical protein SUGI_0706360 [Cryptomeria japonica]